jgi:hypothetical protein
MPHISAELQEAADNLGFAIACMPPDDAAALRRRIAIRYSLDPTYLLAYRQARDAVSIHDPIGWSWLSEFTGQSVVFLLFNQDDDPDVLVIPSGTMILPLLKETTGFPYYLAPPNESYLLCFDDHDCLIGLGAAADWIRQLKCKKEQGTEGLNGLRFSSNIRHDAAEGRRAVIPGKPGPNGQGRHLGRR